jgi:hypothetical protein
MTTGILYITERNCDMVAYFVLVLSEAVLVIDWCEKTASSRFEHEHRRKRLSTSTR